MIKVGRSVGRSVNKMVILYLKGLFELYDPWVAGRSKNISLSTDVTDLCFLAHLSFTHLLYRNDIPSVLVTTHAHLAECASTNDAQSFVVLRAALLTSEIRRIKGEIGWLTVGQ